MPRAYHATVALDGAIYMIGGFDGTQYYNSVKKFDAIEKTWQEVAPMYHQVIQRNEICSCVDVPEFSLLTIEITWPSQFSSSD